MKTETEWYETAEKIMVISLPTSDIENYRGKTRPARTAKARRLRKNIARELHKAYLEGTKAKKR